MSIRREKQKAEAGRALKLAMTEAGLSGTALANSLGVGESAVSNWRKRGVPSHLALRVAKALGVPVTDIAPQFLDESAGGQSVLVDQGDKFTQVEIDEQGMMPDIKRGDLIVFDPLRPPEAGDLCAAKVGGKIIVRTLSMGTGKPVLVPLNKDFPELAKGFKLLGTVIRHTRILI